MERKVTTEIEITESNKTGLAAKEIEKAAERIEKAASKAGDAMGGLGRAAAGVGVGAGAGGGLGGGPTIAGAGPSLFLANQMRLLGLDVAKLRVATVNGPAAPKIAGPAMGWMMPSEKQQLAVGPQIVEGFKSIAMGLGIATAAASGFTASMAPMTFSTLTGSVQLLGNEFVKLLIPAFATASLKIQNLTGWVAGLDDSTKGIISSTAMWVAPSMVMLGVLGALTPVLRLVTGGVFLLGGAILTTSRVLLTGFFAMNGWMAGLTVVTIAVAVLTNGFGLLGDSISRAGERADQARERLARLQQPGGTLTRSDYESMPATIRAQIERTAPDQRRAFLDTHIRWLERQQMAVMETNPARTQLAVDQALEVANRAGGSSPGRRHELLVTALASQGMSRPEAENRVRTAYPAGMSLTAGVFPVPTTTDAAQNTAIRNSLTQLNRFFEAGAELEVTRRVRESGIPGLFEGLRTSTPIQGQMYSSGSEAYYSVVQDVLARGQLEQDILRAIMENTARMVALASGQQAGGVAVAPIPQPGAAPP